MVRKERSIVLQLCNDDASLVCEKWPSPDIIISDGAYGLKNRGGFSGDVISEHLVDWYRPHLESWQKKAKPSTTLWFWNTEVGWATIHPELCRTGWQYVALNTWAKGASHIAGRTNTKTLRSFPVVTEVCAQYVREPILDGKHLKRWLRSEWTRTGLPLSEANYASGVQNAATRKWLTQDEHWYLLPKEAYEALSLYANLRGDPDGAPYFKRSWDELASLLPKFNCPFAVTNVWDRPPISRKERIGHPNQKPLDLMSLTIEASTDPGDVLWEPFGGVFSACFAGHSHGLNCYGAEIDKEFYNKGVSRFWLDTDL